MENEKAAMEQREPTVEELYEIADYHQLSLDDAKLVFEETKHCKHEVETISCEHYSIAEMMARHRKVYGS